MKNWFWLVLVSILYFHKWLKQVHHYSETCTERLLFSGKKNIRFFGILLWKICHCKLNFAFLHINENKNGDISGESLKKSRGGKVSRPHWRTMKPTFGWFHCSSCVTRACLESRHKNIWCIKVLLLWRQDSVGCAFFYQEASNKASVCICPHQV